MSDEPLITGRLIAAARALAGISQSDLANAAGISGPVLARMESSGSAPIQPRDDAETVKRALEDFGIAFIAENAGMGAGVRLKFRRLDAKQIGRFENEGGKVGDDDVP